MASDSPRPSLSSVSSKPLINMPVRYVILALVLLATSVEYVCRYNINVSMVAMVKPVNHSQEIITDGGCPLPEPRSNGTTVPTGTYEWDATTQGVILGGQLPVAALVLRQALTPRQPSSTVTR